MNILFRTLIVDILRVIIFSSYQFMYVGWSQDIDDWLSWPDTDVVEQYGCPARGAQNSSCSWSFGGNSMIYSLSCKPSTKMLISRKPLTKCVRGKGSNILISNTILFNHYIDYILFTICLGEVIKVSQSSLQNRKLSYQSHIYLP